MKLDNSVGMELSFPQEQKPNFYAAILEKLLKLQSLSAYNRKIKNIPKEKKKDLCS